jgi:hypothetical protein
MAFVAQDCGASSTECGNFLILMRRKSGLSKFFLAFSLGFPLVSSSDVLSSRIVPTISRMNGVGNIDLIDYEYYAVY